jgi:hypothetical protein
MAGSAVADGVFDVVGAPPYPRSALSETDAAASEMVVG